MGGELFDYNVARKVVYSPDMARALGSKNEAIFISQLLWYIQTFEDNHKKKVEWYYKKQRFLEEDTALSRWEQQKAREGLKRKGIFEERHGKDSILWFNIDYDVLSGYFVAAGFDPAVMWFYHKTKCGKTTSGDVAKPHDASRENHMTRCGKTSDAISLMHEASHKASHKTYDEKGNPLQKDLPFSHREKIHEQFEKWRFPFPRPVPDPEIKEAKKGEAG